MSWTEKDVRILKTMWQGGKSAREIAERLGTTRNAVIGKANRMTLGSHRSHGDATRKKDPSRASSTDIPLERQCKWPIGHPGDSHFHYCGRPRVSAIRPYCEEHDAQAHAGKKRTVTGDKASSGKVVGEQ